MRAVGESQARTRDGVREESGLTLSSPGPQSHRARNPSAEAASPESRRAGGQALQEPARRRRVLASAACLPSRASVGLRRLLRGSQRAPRLDPNEPNPATRPSTHRSTAGAAGPVFHGKELALRTPLAEPSLSLSGVNVSVCAFKCVFCVCVCVCISVYVYCCTPRLWEMCSELQRDLRTPESFSWCSENASFLGKRQMDRWHRSCGICVPVRVFTQPGNTPGGGIGGGGVQLVSPD